MRQRASIHPDKRPTFRLLLVAQSPVLRYGIRTVLESVVDLDGRVEAAAALEAAASARVADPDLVVIHDALPGLTGIATCGLLRELLPAARIVLMSDDVGEFHYAGARRAGADRLLSMAIDPDDFLTALNGLIGSPAASQDDRLVSDRPVPAPTPALTPLQLAVLDGIVRGLESDEIARRLQIDEPAISAEISALLARLGASDRPSAVTAALRLGLADLRDQLPPPSYAPDFGIESAA